MPHKIDFIKGTRWRCRDCAAQLDGDDEADKHWLDTMTPDERAAYDQREKERNSHQWTTLDGEEYVCFYCDSKTGNGMCPGEQPQDPDEYVASLASKAEREADQIVRPETYELEAEDTPF